MATPLTPSQLLAALQGEGLAVFEYSGWRDRCRCHGGSHERGESPTGRGWGAINGVTIHITTGAANSGAAAVAYTGYLVAGRSDTPGPLCQITIDADGRAILLASGRSNHVGSISQASLDHMIAADFSLDSYQDVRGAGVDGNTHAYGIEIQAPTTPSAVQIEAAVKAAAGICRAYGWTGQEVHGHGEVASARSYSDPNLNMGTFRRQVMAKVGASTSTGGGAAGGVPSGTVTPPPAPPVLPVVSVSALAAAFRRDSAASSPTGRVSYQPAIYVERALAAKGLLNPRYVDGSAGTLTVAAYAAWQRALGYRGRDADGIPGTTSLQRLATDSGLFTVVA